MTHQVLIQLLDDLAWRLRRAIPARRRSAFIQRLLEQALPPEDDTDPLYQAALAVEQDEALASEMAEWDVTAGDGPT